MNLPGEIESRESIAEVDWQAVLKETIGHLLIENAEEAFPLYEVGDARFSTIRVLGGWIQYGRNERAANFGLANVSYPDMDGDETTIVSIGEQRLLLDGAGARRADVHEEGPHEEMAIINKMFEVVTRAKWGKTLSRIEASKFFEENLTWEY